MNNTITSISFSIFSNKGVYALLLGSGISKNAGIATGWDVVQDLILKLATLKHEKCEPTPQEWFESKFGIEANYSTILGKLAKTPDERLNLLKPYFESKDEKQLPSKAHKSIAKLVKSGYIKVIITTNFDRLLENALRDEGIEPTVIKHSEDIKGALPLVHNKFTLIKINGDYLDSRFLNTVSELSTYNDELKNYILNIINEFGIISCGWSAKWDTGLTRVLRESENYRFSSYWTHLNMCESELNDIALFRKGETVEIDSADNFFGEVVENIIALETLNDNHPLNSDIAVARLKKYIVKEEYKIQLHDMYLQQLDILSNRLKELHKSYTFSSKAHLKHLLLSYESNLSIMIPMLINSVYWSKPMHYYLFKEVLSRLYIPSYSGSSCWQGTENFKQFSALLAFYAIGVSAVKVEKYEILESCFSLKVDEDETRYSKQIFFIENVNACYGVIDNEIMNKEVLDKDYRTPVSTYLNMFLRPYFNLIIHSTKDFEKSFDIFEYLISLNFEHLCSRDSLSNWAPWGEYKWRRSHINGSISYFDSLADEQKESWVPIKAGMFNGQYETFLEVRTKLSEHLKTVHL